MSKKQDKRSQKSKNKVKKESNIIKSSLINNNNRITGKRSKIKQERKQRIEMQRSNKEKKKLNSEIFNMITVDKLDTLDFEKKSFILNKLYNLLISYPEQNSDKFELLLMFLQDNNIKIVIDTFIKLSCFFVDVIPSYRIKTNCKNNINQNNNTNKSNNFNYSKEVQQLKNFEDNLLNCYKKFLDSAVILLKIDIKDNLNLKETILTSICSVLLAHPTFNYSDVSSSIIISKLHTSNEANEVKLRLKSYECLKTILSKVDNSKEYLDLKLKIINNLSHMFFNISESKLDINCINLLSIHKVEFPEIKKKEKQSKIEKEVQREINEYENTNNDTNNEEIFSYNLKILKKILLVYLEFLTNKPESKFIRAIIDSISKQAENINVEILHDLQKCIYSYINKKLDCLKNINSTKSLSNNVLVTYNKNINLCITALKTCVIIKEKLTSEIVSIEDSYLLNSIYYLLQKIIPVINNLELLDLHNFMELIHYSMIQNRQFSQEITCSFIKRIAILIISINNQGIAFSFLLLLKRMIDIYPFSSQMIYEDEDIFDNTVNDPSIAGGKQAVIYNELMIINKKGSYCNRIVQQIKERSQVKNKDFINYLEILLNNEKYN